MSKKAMILYSPLLIAIALGFGFFYFGVLASHPSYGTEFLGDISLKVIETAQEAEKALTYLDQSAKLSAHQSIYDLAANGGCQDGEKFLGYIMWGFDENSKCNPKTDLAKKFFIASFSKKLDGFLSNYKYASFQPNNYNLDFKDNSLIGLAIAPLKIPIGEKDGKTKIGEYSIKPSFKVDLSYDFSDYGKLRKGAEELMGLCQSENLETCVYDKKYEIFGRDNFEIAENCENEDQEQFYEFLEYFESCAFSEDNGCICTGYRPGQEKTYEISQQGSGIAIMAKNNMELKQSITNVNLYNDKNEYDAKQSFLHKDNNGKIIVQNSLGTEKQCTPKPKTKFRFCIKSNQAKFLAYDEVDKKAEFRNPTYRFALDFGETEFTKETKVEKVIVTEAVKALFDDKRVIIASECLEVNQDVFNLANQLGNGMAETGNPPVIPVGAAACNELNNPEAFRQKYFDNSRSNILIILDSGVFFGDRINYYSESKKSGDMSKYILNKLYSLEQSYTSVGTIKSTLALSELSTQIIFKSEKLKEENDYADAIFSGIVDYLLRAESPQAIFEYFDVKNPSGIKRGLVDFGWVWETARKENINYYLLLSVIQAESNFANINAPNDGKAHGLGQQFQGAITDIYPDLIIRHQELKGKTSKEIYENTLASKDENSLKVQITATALYLKWTKNSLLKQGKPTDTKTTIQAYHDGVGNINADGSSKLITQNNKEAIGYYPEVASNYNQFSGTALA